MLNRTVHCITIMMILTTYRYNVHQVHFLHDCIHGMRPIPHSALSIQEINVLKGLKSCDECR